MTATMVAPGIPTGKAGNATSRQDAAPEASVSTSDHASRVAKALAKRFGRTPIARQHEIDRARELFTQLARVALSDEAVRQWIPFFIAPLSAALQAPTVDGTLKQVLLEKCRADAAEDPLLLECAEADTPENRRKLAKALREERARGDVVLAILEAPGGANGR